MAIEHKKTRTHKETPDPSRRLRMEDLAAIAGVSKITISRALRDSELVRPEVRARENPLSPHEVLPHEAEGSQASAVRSGLPWMGAR